MKTENRHINFQEPEGMMLLRYIKDTASNKEKSYIEAWLEADENNKRILLQTARIYYANNAMERIASRNPLIAYEKLEQRLVKRARLYWLKRFSVAAACIIAIIGLSSLISYIRVGSSTDDPQYITLEANAGIRTHFNLPDGTVVYLNSGSSLSYPVPYDSKERKVCLSGEAYFKVTKDAKHPFIVKSGNLQVRVLGTEFNVRSYSPIDVRVTLITGKVAGGGVCGIYTCGIHSVEMMPGQSAQLSSDGTFAVNEVDIESFLYWKEGFFYFDDVALVDMMKEIGRWYNIDIEFRNSKIMDLRMHFFANRHQDIFHLIELLNRMERIHAHFETGKLIIE